jgi:hypothetical protein
MKNQVENKDKVCSDCQQNQLLLKLSAGEISYSREVWFFNINIIKTTSDGKQKEKDIPLC